MSETFKSSPNRVESLKKALGAPAGSYMGGEDSLGGGSTGERMLLLRAEGCLLCVALEVVEGVFEQHSGDGTAQPEVDVVDWTDVSGLRSDGTATERSSLVVVRTPEGAVGFGVDACLGVRDVSFLETPPVPTRLASEQGHPLCYLVLLDGQAHFLIEPCALVRARARMRAANASVSAAVPPPPQAPAAGS